MSTTPKFLTTSPKSPILKQRLYNGRKIMVWEGRARFESIIGWVDNPRIELAKKKLIQKVGNRDLTQEEISDLMKNSPEIKLKELRDDIINNGLREPLTLSFSGKLLDGNRRYFAIRYALETMPVTDPNREDLEIVNVYVLTEDASEKDEQNVLVEENFSASLKIEWPDYVKAMKVIAEYENGLKQEEIAKKFNWQKSKVRETIRINEITSEFMAFATSEKDPEDESGGGLGISEQEAETIVAKSYQYFNEAQKSFFDAIKTDFEFKIQFFRWVAEEKFSSWPEVRIAHKAWKDPEAKAAIMQPEITAAKSAKAILEYNSRVVRSTDEAVGRIDSFIKFLNEMAAVEIKKLPIDSRAKLQNALEMVIKMNIAAE